MGPGVKVGSGGFGTVFRAEQLGLGRPVAVKVLAAVVDQDVELRRFERERQALGSVADHPNIVSVIGWGVTAERRPYLVMEYLPGGTLADLVKEGPLSPVLAVSVAAKLARALAVAHERGVLHRDVKPENVLVSAFGEPVLCDFGIARPAEGAATHTTSVSASLTHAPPEVLEGLPPSEAGDVWALTSTLHTLLAGRPPFAAMNGQEAMAAVITRVLTKPPPDLRERGVPDDVGAVVEAGLAKNPADRLGSAAAVADRLEAVMAAHGWSHQLLTVTIREPRPLSEARPVIGSSHTSSDRGAHPHGANPSTAPDPSTRSKRKSRTGLAAWTLALATIVVGGAFLTGRRQPSNDDDGRATPPVVLSQVPTPSIAPESFTSFEDKETGIRLAVPKDWVVQSKQNLDASYRLIIRTPDTKDSLRVRVNAYSSEVTSTNIGDQKAVIDAIFAAEKITMLADETLTLNGLPTLFYVYKFVDSTGEPGIHAQFFVFQGRKMVTMVFETVPEARYPVQARLFDMIKDSLTVAPGPPPAFLEELRGAPSAITVP